LNGFLFSQCWLLFRQKQVFVAQPRNGTPFSATAVNAALYLPLAGYSTPAEK